MTATLSPFDSAVLSTIGRITNPRTGAFRKVYPHDVVIYLPVHRSIRQLRRDMNALVQTGVLQRIGPRRGYRLIPLTPYQETLVQTIDRLTRHGAYHAVFPRQVAQYLPFTRSVRQIRRDMVALWKSQHLHRIGQRKGYRIADAYQSHLCTHPRPALLQ